MLPDGDVVAAHAHITEVGRIDKTFIDCGGTVRKISTCSLQAWVADDTDHRLNPATLAAILDRAAPILADEDLEVEIEYEDCQISQFPVESVTVQGDGLEFSPRDQAHGLFGEGRLPAQRSGRVWLLTFAFCLAPGGATIQPHCPGCVGCTRKGSR